MTHAALRDDARERAGDAIPVVGLIVPPAHGQVPGDGAALYGEDRVRFIARGLALGEITTRGYEGVIDRVVGLAGELAGEGARAVSLMGTSLSFFRGAAFNAELEAEMARRTGVPCTTMSNAIVRALAAVDVARVAVATAYVDDVNERLCRYLAANDLAVTAIRGLSITGVGEVAEVPTTTLVELCEAVFAVDRRADGILISCGGLLTLEAIAEVEAKLGVPVVSSSPAGFWDVMRVAGLDSESRRGGRLFRSA
ncbi:MAG TPA: arylmalonate decarboxylase [Caldimonas sp.]|nr:arylmalonate decarboxylase [Caldimonas sp.]